ncbi:MAG: hypothetical protein ACKVHE_23555 [Planctomycetales bacterium]|jgi:hypothetical protein
MMSDTPSDDDRVPDAEVAVLARLLSDVELRRRFVEDPERVALEITDAPLLVTFLVGLNPAQLEAQAVTLVSKRQHEVSELLPKTWRRLGATAASLFRAYAAGSVWPGGHTRHLQDAEAFARWLTTKADCRPEMAEWNRVRFALSGRRAEIRFVRGRGARCGFQLLFRHSNGCLRELVLGLGRPIGNSGESNLPK